MVRSKSAKRFERLAHTVMILVTICIVLPFILLFMSSITSESALVRDGYSFFPKEFSIHAYKFIWDNAANVFRASGIYLYRGAETGDHAGYGECVSGGVIADSGWC